MTVEEFWYMATLLAAVGIVIGGAFVAGHQIGYSRGRWDKVGPLVNALLRREQDLEDVHGPTGRPRQDP